MEMNTVILVGNTNTKIACVNERTVLKVLSIRTQDIERSIAKYLYEFNGTIYLASVVPEASFFIRRKFDNIEQITWKHLPFRIKVKQPDRVGIDRLLNALGAWQLYKRGCVIIDAGSAITIDLMNNRGDFEGGVIFPGEKLIIDSLRTLALLKNAKMSMPVFLVGKNTSEAIGSGIIYGLSFLVSGYIRAFKEKNPLLEVVFTGGSGRALCRRIKQGCYIEHLGVIGAKSVIYGKT
ncbi:MAG: type III pantothenate kinase [Candidatus Ratteibacteria bacterium]